MRKLSTGNVVVPYKVDEAGHTRDAMTKTLYALMFEWIIKQINKTLEVSDSIGVGIETRVSAFSFVSVRCERMCVLAGVKFVKFVVL